MMLCDKKVSIIVGIYNSEKFLRKGLESIKNQTYHNIEVLMMDDGSPDNSGKICDEYAKVDDRFIAVHKKNTGVCDSRNMGIDLATGDYICFMDGDDWLALDFVEYMMKIVEVTGASMAFSDHLFTSYDQTQTPYDNIEIWDSERTILHIIYLRMVLGPWNKIYSMRTIQEHNIRFPEHWFGETLHFASTVAYYSNIIGMGHRKVYNYRLDNANSGTTQFNVETRLLSLENAVNLQHCVFSKNHNIMKAIKWHIHACYFTLLVNIIGCKEIEKYKLEYNYSIKYLRHQGLTILMDSEVDIKEKMRIIARAYFPKCYAYRVVNRINRNLKRINDGFSYPSK